MERIISCEQLDLKLDGELLLHNISFSLVAGEMLALIGPSACGKTVLGRLVSGMLKHSAGEFDVQEGVQTVFVEQQDNFFAQSGMRHTYYSQRYEYFEGRAVPTVATLLKIDIDTWQDDKKLLAIVEKLNIEYLLDRQLLLLSNGERKRVQIVSALMQNPDLFVFDQPFIGLDVDSRRIVRGLLHDLKIQGKTVLLICSKKEVPETCDRVVEMCKGEIVSQLSYEEFAAQALPKEDTLNVADLELPLPEQSKQFETLVRMRHVDVAIAGKQILQDINWEVKRNERWLLAGHNGSGKSTLLSLVTADNPHGYNKDLMLFDRMRGTGETVWDIKENIGFVSPELHLYFLRQTHLTGHRGTMMHSIDCLSVLVSGFNEEIGFSSKSTVYQENIATQWVESLGLAYVLKKQFAELSLGEQRMLLLIRALIKNPPLLILDEPCQGIDAEQSQRFVQILDLICEKLNITMIYVSHSAEEIPNCISHKLELEAGKAIYNGVYKR